ncbi:MAG: hypothetical protein KF705_04170 [Phycisphaeraceae bacterium]|nr:hypothetical protein [Phycisphaeraceae bacterium]
MSEVREQIRSGTDLTMLKWHELVNVENLEIDDGEPIVMEIREFLGAVSDGRRPTIDAASGSVNVRVAERIVEAIKENR